MSSTIRRSTYLSRHLQLLREKRSLRPGQLAVALGASNPSKVGSLIRCFELGEPISDHWLQALIAALQPDPDDLRHCLALDQEEAQRQLEVDRQAWEAWADEPIEPYLSIRYSPGAGLVRKVPKAFCSPRETEENKAWARQRAEDWATDQLRRCPHKAILIWSRRESTSFEPHGLNPCRRINGFNSRSSGAWMQVSGSQRKFLLDFSNNVVTRGFGLDQPRS